MVVKMFQIEIEIYHFDSDTLDRNWIEDCTYKQQIPINVIIVVT